MTSKAKGRLAPDVRQVINNDPSWFKKKRSQLHALLGSNALLNTMHGLLCPFASTVHVQLLSAHGHARIQTSKQAELFRLRHHEKGMGASTCDRNRTKRRRQAPMLPLRWSPPRSHDGVLRSLLAACSVPPMPCSVPLLQTPQINTTSWSW
jgi:hypothetical protein